MLCDPFVSVTITTVLLGDRLVRVQIVRICRAMCAGKLIERFAAPAAAAAASCGRVRNAKWVRGGVAQPSFDHI